MAAQEPSAEPIATTQSDLFKDIKFFLRHKLPARQFLLQDVQKHSGHIVRQERGADVCIGDPLRGDNIEGAISYKWIEDSIKKNELLDNDQYRCPLVPDSAGPISGSKETRKKTRTEYTAAEDRMIIDYIRARGSENDASGNVIWQDFIAQHPESKHSWQSWRDRYRTHHKGRIFVSEPMAHRQSEAETIAAIPGSRISAANAQSQQQALLHEETESEIGSEPDATNRQSVRSKREYTSEEDLMLCNYVMRSGLSGTGKAVFKKMAMEIPGRTWQSYQGRYRSLREKGLLPGATAKATASIGQRGMVPNVPNKAIASEPHLSNRDQQLLQRILWQGPTDGRGNAFSHIEVSHLIVNMPDPSMDVTDDDLMSMGSKLTRTIGEHTAQEWMDLYRDHVVTIYTGRTPRQSTSNTVPAPLSPKPPSNSKLGASSSTVSKRKRASSPMATSSKRHHTSHEHDRSGSPLTAANLAAQQAESRADAASAAVPSSPLSQAQDFFTASNGQNSIRNDQASTSEASYELDLDILSPPKRLQQVGTQGDPVVANSAFKKSDAMLSERFQAHDDTERLQSRCSSASSRKSQYLSGSENQYLDLDLGMASPGQQPLRKASTADSMRRGSSGLGTQIPQSNSRPRAASYTTVTDASHAGSVDRPTSDVEQEEDSNNVDGSDNGFESISEMTTAVRSGRWRERQVRSQLDTQAIMDAETQALDVSMSPVISVTSGSSSAAEELWNSQDHDVIALPPADPPAEHNSASQDSVLERLMDSGFSDTQIEDALHAASAREKLAEAILLDQKHNRIPEEDPTWQWTAEEDNILQGFDAKALKALEAKHGREEFRIRQEYLQAMLSDGED